MSPITSGTTVERIVRTLLVSVLVDVFAGLYLWDGFVGYERQNAQEFAHLMGMPADASPDVLHDLSSIVGRQWVEDLRPGTPFTDNAGRLGSPAFRQSDAVYYLGPNGWLKIELRDDRVQSATWSSAAHSESDLQLQRWIGFALLIVGLGATFQLARVVTTRAILTDDGLQISGRKPISFESMIELRKPSSGQAGVVELVHEIDGRKNVAKLDKYVIKELPAIVAAICEFKSFENPMLR